jgi:hypothetical protein
LLSLASPYCTATLQGVPIAASPDVGLRNYFAAPLPEVDPEPEVDPVPMEPEPLVLFVPLDPFAPLVFVPPGNVPVGAVGSLLVPFCIVPVPFCPVPWPMDPVPFCPVP